MSENQSREDMNFKEDEEGEEKPKIQSTLGNTGKFQPIKTRLRQLEKDMQELRNNINNFKSRKYLLIYDFGSTPISISQFLILA